MNSSCPSLPWRVALGVGLITAGSAQAISAATLPLVQVTHDDTIISQSCRVEIKSVIPDTNRNGVLIIAADNVTVRFQAGTELRGATPDVPWDRLQGIGVRIDGRTNVTLLGLQVHGFRNGIVATRADGLTIDGGDYSDNYRQHLQSTPQAENGADWLFPHHNDETKWRDEYGGAVCVESAERVTIRNIRVRRGQNGLILDRVNHSAVYDNDCSFLSGWGLALWRSSNNKITRNAFDFCVRGHVEGVYNRGQDSAGILCFEQSSDNLFAENSVTHGGDCFFGFAGHEAIGETWMNRERTRLRKETGQKEVDSLIQVPPELAKSMSALGCNRNLIIANDLSYSPAHGIEMTFSEGNQFVRNRLVENAICGVWGGYSSGTLIAENDFDGNGGMAYGLECGGINMEHAADNQIVRNRFANNKCAIHLWWDDDGALMKFPGVAGTEKGVVGNRIIENRFKIDTNAPFPNLRKETQLVLLRLRDTGVGHVHSNYFIGNSIQLSHPQAVAFAMKAGTEPLTNGPRPTISIPKYQVLGRARPVGARRSLSGREQIIMDEWGPWDHETPLLRLAPAARGEQAYDLFGFRQAISVRVLEGDIKTTLSPANADSPIRGGRRLTIQARPGVAKYRVQIASGNFQQEVAGVLVAADWNVRVFPWKIDPREDLPGWRKLAEGPDARSAQVARIDFPFGMGGPRDLKLSPEITKEGPDANHFGLIAKTTLDLPKGRWRFHTTSDDGVRVLVNGKPVIENWTWHVPTENDAVYEQSADGKSNIVVEYFEIDGFATLRLEIEPVNEKTSKR